VKELRILVGRHYGWEGKHETSIILDNVLPVLRNKFKVTIIWFFYMPEKMTDSYKKNSNEDFVDIHDFNNAVEILKKVRPNLIFDNEFPSLMDLAIDTAAKYLKIPVVSRMNASTEFKISRKELFTTFMPSFFHSSMPFEENKKKQFMRRGRFFMYKYWFLLKTLRATQMSIAKIIRYFFIVLNWHMSYKVPYIDSRFANTLHFLENQNLVERCLKAGYERSSLVVTGNPIYDRAFKKYHSHKPKIKKEKISVLFAPLQTYESGVWTKKQRDFAITEIVKNVCGLNDFSLIVKLHPSSQVYSEYESIIHSINSSIPIYQKGAIDDYIDESDVVVSFVPISSVAIYALIAHKPLILCNFFNYEKDFFLNRKLTLECKNPSELNSLIEKGLTSDFIPEDRINNFIREFLYKSDGMASERLYEAIANLVNKIRD
jgi:hypothetical protein